MSASCSLKAAGGIVARGYSRLLNACGMAAGLAIAAIAVLISADVIMRNFGWGNSPWLLEVTEYAVYITTFMAAPWVLHLGAHVRVDLLVHAVPDRIGQALELATSIAGVVISGFLIYHGVLVTTEAHELNAIVVKELAVPEWMLLIVIPISGSMLMIEFIRRGVRVVREGQVGAPESMEL